MTTTHPHIGSSFDELLINDGTLDRMTNRAVKRVLAWKNSPKPKENSVA